MKITKTREAQNNLQLIKKMVVNHQLEADTYDKVEKLLNILTRKINHLVKTKNFSTQLKNKVDDELN